MESQVRNARQREETSTFTLYEKWALFLACWIGRRDELDADRPPDDDRHHTYYTTLHPHM